MVLRVCHFSNSFVLILILVYLWQTLLQALHANALPVLDMCKQWLAQYM